MKNIRWLSGDRIIPGLGSVTTGQILHAPDFVAASFIAQGEAAEVINEPTKKATSTNIKEEPKS